MTRRDDEYKIITDVLAARPAGAKALLQALDAAGFVVVRKVPPEFFNGVAKAQYRMNVEQGRMS